MQKSILALFITLLSNTAFGILPNGINISTEKKLKVALRAVGHELLLCQGDKSSVVLPIIQDSNVFRVSLSNHIAFNPDDLITITNQVLTEYGIHKNYLVEVIHCDSKDITHSFIGSTLYSDLEAPCIDRRIDLGCYEILWSDITDQSNNNKSLNNENEYRYAIIGLLMICLGCILFIFSRLKRKIELKQSPINILQLADATIDEKSMTISSGKNMIKLSHKEYELFILLFNNENKIVSRKEILMKVWDDEGDYVGRTLDVFISRLRKKLQSISAIQIDNVRGVGYKMVVNIK